MRGIVSQSAENCTYALVHIDIYLKHTQTQKLSTWEKNTHNCFSEWFYLDMQRNVQSQSQQSAPQSTWPSGTASSHPSSVGSGLGHYGTSTATLGSATNYSTPNGSGSHYSATSYHHDAYYPSGDAYESQHHHHGVSMYGRDPSIGGISSQVAGPPPAPIITQV